MKTLCWIRRDLRLHDHAALFHALQQGEATVVFIFDTHILDKLKDKSDKRVTFIYQSLQEMEERLQKLGSSLVVLYGKPEEEIPKLCEELKINKVFTNRDYEPYAKKRDELVAKRLKSLTIDFETFKDSVFFEKHEVLTASRGLYKVFTPYKNKWLEQFEAMEKVVPEYQVNLKNLRKFKNPKNILTYNWYRHIGFSEDLPLLAGGTLRALKLLKKFEGHIDRYKKERDYPALEGTSHLSVYLRFGNLSLRDMIRTAVSKKGEGSSTWLSEIIWRDFYQMILDSHPYAEKKAIKQEYDQIKWPGRKAEFEAWCEGRTGFPLIDAAMRCLNETGMMHNRLRMVVASFLCKTLLIDWREGERYFAQKLLDFDLAANNGGWQWVSGSGHDAQPYFRIFNPYTQSKKFDPEGKFIRKWVPELKAASSKEIHRPDTMLFISYPPPVVDYELARKRCLILYASSLGK